MSTDQEDAWKQVMHPNPWVNQTCTGRKGNCMPLCLDANSWTTTSMVIKVTWTLSSLSWKNTSDTPKVEDSVIQVWFHHHIQKKRFLLLILYQEITAWPRWPLWRCGHAGTAWTQQLTCQPYQWWHQSTWCLTYLPSITVRMCYINWNLLWQIFVQDPVEFSLNWIIFLWQV